jgi:hypothetical protein
MSASTRTRLRTAPSVILTFGFEQHPTISIVDAETNADMARALLWFRRKLEERELSETLLGWLDEFEDA